MGKQRLTDLYLTQIKVDEANRKDLGDIEELARDIEKRGLLYPIVVVPYSKNEETGVVKIGREALAEENFVYWLCDGERRYEAVKHLGQPTIQVSVKTDNITILEMYEIMFAGNAKRLEMNPYDMAKAIERFIKQYRQENPDKVDRDAIKRLQGASGFSLSHLESRLKIIDRDVPIAIQRMIQEKTVGANVPTEIKSNIPKKYQSYAFDRVANDKIISTLEFRETGRQIKAVDRMVTLTETQKHDVAKALIDTGGRTNWAQQTQDNVSNYPLYLGEIEKIRLRIDLWNLDNITPAQQSDLAGRLGDLASHFRNRQKIAQGITEKGALKINNFKRTRGITNTLKGIVMTKRVVRGNGRKRR